MDSRPPNLLLLSGLLLLWPCARGQSSYTINSVDLAILPSTSVQSGTRVTVRCQVSVSHDNIPNLTHTFELKRDDVLVHSLTTAVDSMDYELDPARVADSGTYECRVTVKEKNKGSLGHKLEVIGLQTPFLYLDKTRPYESEEFRASCSAPDEKGSLIFRFYQRFRNGRSEMIKQPAPTGNSTETTLVLRLVGDSILYCDYEISPFSWAGRSNHSNEIQVIVRELFISPIMNINPDIAFEGDLVEVICKVVNPPKNVEVFLRRDDKILKQASVTLIHQFRATEGDSGELVCKAEWGSVQKESYKTLTVKELYSKPRLTLAPADLFEGDTFKLTCSVTIYVPDRINNRTLSYSIYKNNVKVTSSETYITQASIHSNGNYTCKAQATTLTHSFVKESPVVVVKAKVPVSKPKLSVVGGALVLGKPFQLLCHCDVGTLPITYTLFGQKKQLGSRVVSRPGDSAIFNSSAIYKRSDLSNFLCHAKNSQRRPPTDASGLMLLRTTNITEPVSKPVLSMLPSEEDVSEGQDLTLVCSVERGTFPIIFTWYHADKREVLTTKTFWEREGSFKIKSIKGEDRGGYYCESTNPANEIRQSKIVTIGVKMAGWKKGLIAVFCVLILLALILVFIFKRHLLQFKRRRTAELSVKSAGTKAERLSLTQAEVNEAANVTPGMIGKSVWSEHASGSESDDQNSVSAPEKQESQYTEVQIKQLPPTPNRVPVTKGTDTVYSEVRNSRQSVPEQADGGSVEYAQLNHDADPNSDQGNHGDHAAQEEHTVEIDNSADNSTADHGE